jgi:electron transport complex protein RnfC
VEAPIGALVTELLAFCGGSFTESARLLMGGAMMGQILPSAQVPIVKGSNGILALATGEIPPPVEASPCIRCGRCVDACPMGLMPLEIAKRARCDDLKGSLDFGLEDCLSCGSCAYICPAHIPLVQYLEFAKGELASRRRSEQKAKETRRLITLRQTRLARQEMANKEAAARRQAEKRRARQRTKAEV